jgi:hypothetical protein
VLAAGSVAMTTTELRRSARISGSAASSSPRLGTFRELRSDGAKSERAAPGVQSTGMERTALEDCVQGFFSDAVGSKTIACTHVRRVLAEVLQRAPEVLDEITHRDTLSMS